LFTGIVEGVATVTAAASRQELRILDLTLPEGIEEGVRQGDSLNVAGACLTVAGRFGREVRLELVPETLARTRLGAVRPGDGLNVERAMALGARLGGHLVMGHVDGVAAVCAFEMSGDAATLTVEPPPGLMRYLPEKAFVALDGVSLTVARAGGDRFVVALVPETLRRTTLSGLRPGDRLDLEVDPLARYVEALLSSRERGGMVAS
jgi:riboflavin synthase